LRLRRNHGARGYPTAQKQNQARTPHKPDIAPVPPLPNLYRPGRVSTDTFAIDSTLVLFLFFQQAAAPRAA